MKFEPVNKWLIGRAMVPRSNSALILPAAIKQGVSRCYLIESVSDEAREKGYAPGEILVASKVYDMIIKEHRVVLLVEDIVCRVKDCTIDEFVDLENKPVEPVIAPANGHHEVVGAPA